MSAPQVIKDLDTWRSTRQGLNGSVGFVPTMGALHAGHAELLATSVAQNDYTVLSIYVNPTQFNDPNDLGNYPQTLCEDLEMARQCGVDFVLMPSYNEIYADGFRYQVEETQFSRELCGMNRPGHFTGVLTVVMKLLNLVQAQRAYFGKKDYQQYQLVKDMCATFFMPVEIVGCETVRESDGLAMSSRNLLLDQEARAHAALFSCVLRQPSCDTVVTERLAAAGFDVDYVETHENRRFGAVTVTSGAQQVRLIDNVELSRSTK